jgi:hypothetical protein
MPSTQKTTRLKKPQVDLLVELVRRLDGKLDERQETMHAVTEHRNEIIRGLLSQIQRVAHQMVALDARVTALEQSSLRLWLLEMRPHAWKMVCAVCLILYLRAITGAWPNLSALLPFVGK